MSSKGTTGARGAGGWQIGRYAAFRRLMTQQFRASLQRKDRKGVVSIAEIARLYEMAIEETWSNGTEESLRSVPCSVHEGRGRVPKAIYRETGVKCQTCASNISFPRHLVA